VLLGHQPLTALEQWKASRHCCEWLWSIATWANGTLPFFIFLGKLANDIYILFDDIRNKYFASIFMFGSICILVFNADFNTHIACTMAVDNLFRVL